MQPAQSTNACRPTSRVSRPRNGRAALVVVAILCATPLKTEAALPPELEEIAEAYRQHYQTLKTLRIVCEEIPTPLMDRDVLWKHRKFYDAFPSMYTIVVQEGKVHHHTVRTKKPLGKVMDLLRKEEPSRDVIGSISLAEIQRLLPSVAEETSDATSVYDGSVLRVKSAHCLKVMDEKRRCYTVKDTSKQGFRYLPDGYPHYILYAPLLPNLPTDNRYAQENRFPDLFSHAPVPPSVGRERVGDTDCVVVEAPGYQKLWLDPERGFAVRRRKWYSDGMLIVDQECDDFVEVASDIWMPRTLLRTYVAASGFPEEYRGQPYIENRIRVSTIEVNDPKHAALFTLKAEPGAFVFDQTLRPVDSEGKPIDKPPREGCLPGVSYVQPADEADLEEVVRRAQRDQGASLEARQPADEADSEEVVQRVQQDQGAILEARQPTHWSWKWWFFMLVSVVVLAAVGGLFLSRRFHRARLKRMQS